MVLVPHRAAIGLGRWGLAQQFAQRLYELGVLVTGFFYPVVPMGQARVRVQISAAHSREQLDAALAAFAQAGRELGLLKK